MTQPVKKPEVEELCFAHSPEITTEDLTPDECNSTVEDQEATLIALVEHRTREVHHLQQRISYYTRQVFTSCSSTFPCQFFYSYYPSSFLLIIIIIPDWQQCQLPRTTSSLITAFLSIYAGLVPFYQPRIRNVIFVFVYSYYLLEVRN